MSEERLMKIEIALANCEKTIEDLNEVVIEQGRKIDALIKHQKHIMEMLNQNDIKPLSEETPPPHY